ncbi:hypothetical protein [Bradyrhizobium sp. ERR14]|uniref:hypothetical protein n=1 Tax=Bradyrhizobium sp. ERR14 TaxID=2663837 RepID=UPI0017E016B1|nr:hypothetical protein [Bradyrhizobium sp. ERR14]MBB4394300.1 hypothetical protein [Bradyrhizobium sp. ERR14]
MRSRLGGRHVFSVACMTWCMIRSLQSSVEHELCSGPSMFRAVVIIVLAFALSGCDAFGALKDGMQRARAVKGDLEQSTGVRPQVGFNWRNGRLASVTVMFPGLYQTKPLGDLAGLVRETVTREFKQAPDAIVLSFALGKGPLA